MTERGTKTLIGAFVVGGITLLIAGVLLIGSGTLFSKNASFVLYFNSSLRGLVQGAPVYFKGVRVGKVTSIQINAESDDLTFRTPVIIELESSLISGARGDDTETYNVVSDEKAVNDLILKGLRANLGMQSFVTGQLSVDLDMLPNADYVDPTKLPRFRGMQEIPTAPSSLDAMIDVVRRLPVDEIVAEALKALQTINKQAEGLDLAALSKEITALSRELRGEVAHWGEVRAQAVTALRDVSKLARGTDDRLGLTLRRADEALTNVSALAVTSRKSMEGAGALLRPDSPTMLEFDRTMTALREASAAISALATELELKPESLIFGRTRR